MSEEWGGIHRRGDFEPPALELIVPGTQPASPERLLGEPRTVRIGGDRRTRLHRRVDDMDAEQRPEDYRNRPIPETYTWGSGPGDAPARGLWLLLLPLSLVNLAAWMSPPSDGSHARQSRAARTYMVLMRLLAAALTVHLVVAIMEISMDLTVWQCAAPGESCAEENTWLLFIRPANGSWWARPGPSLALGAMVALLVIGLLTRLSRRTWARTEALKPASSAFRSLDEDDTDASGQALSLPGFWYGRRQVSRLRAAHTALALSTVALLLLAVLLSSQRVPDNSLAAGLEWALGALVVLNATVAVWVVVTAGRSERRVDERRNGIAAVSSLVAMGLFVLALAYAYLAPGWPPSGELPGIEELFVGLLAVEMAMVAGLFVCCVPRKARTVHPQMVLRGFGGPVVALIACWLATISSAGAAATVAGILDGGRIPGTGSIAGPPPLIRIGALGAVLVVCLAVLFAVVVSVRHTRRVRHLRFVVEQEYAGEPPDQLRSDEIARAHSSASLTETVPVLLAAVGAVASLHLAVMAVGASDAFAYSALGDAVDVVTELGSWLGPILVILLVLAGWMAYTWPAARRSVGLLWDISTFWPRAAHPFGPPCLAERAVPDLQWRMLSWMHQTGGRVLLSGHGQGSVLAAAAVFQLEPTYRSRVALHSYGSPLARIYGRYFPAYFGPAQLHWMEREVDVWRNLWRVTDPIGGPISLDSESGVVDSGPLRDPLAFGRTPQHPLYAPILCHEDYQADPVFAADRAALLARLAPRVPPTRTADPHLP